MSKYSKVNFIYFMQKWMDSVPGQTFLNYAYSWGAAVVILGTLFKLTHMAGANEMLFIGMGTEVFVFFISAFDRPFDKSTHDMTLDNHMEDNVIENRKKAREEEDTDEEETTAPANAAPTIIIGAGAQVPPKPVAQPAAQPTVQSAAVMSQPAVPTETVETAEPAAVAPQVFPTPAPAVSAQTAEAMEAVTQAYVERLEELNDTLQKVSKMAERLSVDSEEMENLNRTLTGISRIYEMQLKSASQQITTQDSINEQTQVMANKIKELNSIYARMIEAMTTNVPGAAPRV